MRIYARYIDVDGNMRWELVQTDSATGSNDMVYIVNLIQALLLNLNESPFYANYGIPAALAVATQTPPDYYVAQTQQQFAPFFASLVITKAAGSLLSYNISIVTNQGVTISFGIPVNELSQNPA